jgi:hypothetical protein
MLIILASRESEVRRILVQNQVVVDSVCNFYDLRYSDKQNLKETFGLFLLE